MPEAVRPHACQVPTLIAVSERLPGSSTGELGGGPCCDGSQLPQQYVVLSSSTDAAMALQAASTSATQTARREAWEGPRGLERK